MTTFISLFFLMFGSVFGVKAQDALPTTHHAIGYAQVELVIKPEALNVNPGVLTAYLKFPEPFGVPQTINATLDGAPLERWEISNEGLPEEGLEGPIVIMKFRRQDIENALAEKGEVIDTEFILKGKFNDGTAMYGQPYDFEGRDFIMKIIEK